MAGLLSKSFHSLEGSQMPDHTTHLSQLPVFIVHGNIIVPLFKFPINSLSIMAANNIYDS